MNSFAAGLAILRPFFVCLSLCLAIGCAKREPDRQVWMQRGQEALVPLKTDLKEALVEALQGGPEEAIDVCRVMAPEIARNASSQNIRVGRTSHRLRNKQNAPEEWMRRPLERYAAAGEKGGPEVVFIDDGRVGYVEPIYIQSMCLACHGRALSPSVAARIGEYYPEDNARGFDDGEFRGLFWVEFTKPE